MTKVKEQCMTEERSRCLLLINTLSGRGGILNKEIVKEKLEKQYGRVDVKIIENENFDMDTACKGYDYLAIGGGDGTLNRAINYAKSKNVNLIYIPCGTLNDTYKGLRYADKPESIDLGKVDGRYFSYVLAAGTFTPIGYNTNIKLKRAIKQLAYFLTIFREYKTHNISARVAAGNEEREGEYTLIMVVNSRRVFGFPFNKLYENNSGKAHLLLISSPKGILPARAVKLFLLFFRAFFIGFNKETDTKSITFKEIEEVTLTLSSPTDFCIDGEKHILRGENRITMHKDGIKLLYL
jgi:diacylglycerol kinase family enzyme